MEKHLFEGMTLREFGQQWKSFAEMQRYCRVQRHADKDAECSVNLPESYWRSLIMAYLYALYMRDDTDKDEIILDLETMKMIVIIKLMAEGLITTDGRPIIPDQPLSMN